MLEFYLPSFDGQYAERVEFKLKHNGAYKTAVFNKVDDAGTYELSDIIYDGCVSYLYEKGEQEKLMTRKEFLQGAEKCVCTDREGQYGAPEDNFGVIAEFWNSYLKSVLNLHEYDYIVDCVDVAVMMALLKIARISTGEPKADNWIDLIGYAACGGEIQFTGGVENE